MIKLELNNDARHIYDHLEKNLWVQGRRTRVRARLEITLAVRLQQITGGYLCSDKSYEQIDSTKLDWVEKNVKDSTPCIIVCRYRHELDALANRLYERFKLIMVRGGEPLLSPKPNVDIVLIQTSAGIGIDLSQASTIIFYSWDYSFINYEQMRFRILSRTQTTARYIFLMIENSIDEVIYDAAVKKKKLSVAINDHYR